MHQIKLSIVFLTIVLINISISDQYGEPAEMHKIYGTAIAIFPKSNINLIGSGDKFTPSFDVVQLIENMLNDSLAEHNKNLLNQDKSPIIHKKLKKYYRQYIGYIDQNGNRIIYINAFWKKRNFDNWLLQPIMVLDGGSYYWSIKYNIDQNRFFDLDINGYG